MNRLTYSETRSLVIIQKSELASISTKKGITTRTLQSLSSTLNESARINTRRIDGNLILPPISVNKSSVMPVAMKMKGISTMKSIKPGNSKGKSRCPLISTTNQITKDSFVENNKTEQIPFSVEKMKDFEVRSQVHFSHPFRVVWLYSNNTNSNINYKHAIDRFRQSVHKIDIFTDLQKCLDFLRKETNEKIILILSIDSIESTVNQIHNLSQLYSIIIYQIPMPKDRRWIEPWTKIEGFFIDIEKICSRLKEETQQNRRESMSLSISINLDSLSSSFMYSQLLKEVILEMEDDDKAEKDLIEFFRKCSISQLNRKKIIDELEQFYSQHSPIWWYTRDCFVSEMINRALRLQDINTIIQTRFFIRNLHKQIEQLYVPPVYKLTLYRGQGLPYGDFEQLRALKGGLYSFHSFLSTSHDRDVALTFASSSRDDPYLIGIIFHIDIDPNSLKSAVYASSNAVGYYTEENEILFTMHTVFRIGKIKKIDYHLYQVQLSLTNDDDQDLKNLAENIRQATYGSTGWDRLGKLLLKMGKFDQSEEVYNVLIKNSSKDDLKGLAHHYHLLGLVKQQRNDHDNALVYFKKTLDIYKTLSDSRHLDFGTLYNEIGSVYQHKGDYPEALKFHQMALDTQSESNPLNKSDLVITYGHLAEIHKHMKYYPKALEFYQKKLNIDKQSNPFNYSNLSHTYENLAEMYYQMNQYSEALKFFRKVLNIRQHRLHLNDTQTAISFNNIGKVHEAMKENDQAMAQYKSAREILIKSVSKNFSQLTLTCYKIAGVYKKMGESRNALNFYHETIRNSARTSNLQELNLATVHDDIGQMYEDIGEYKQALLSYRQAIQKEQQSLSQNDSQLELFRKHLDDVTKKY